MKGLIFVHQGPLYLAPSAYGPLYCAAMRPIIYILHAKQDVEQEVALSTQLAFFERIDESIKVLRDRDVLAGDMSQKRREQAVDEADIVVLLITPSFWLGSEYELTLRAMSKEKRVIPILVKATRWTETKFGGLRPLPSDERFIESTAEKDAAWADVVDGLMRVWQSIANAAAALSAKSKPTPTPELPPARPRPPLRQLLPGEKVRVVFVAANPSETARLQLLEELHQVKNRLLRTSMGARLDIILEPELRLNQLNEVLTRHRPHIVHFSGHGNTDGSILLVDPDHAGKARAMDPLTLRELFLLLPEGIPCVVLNSCYSVTNPELAQALANVVGCVIGMDAGIFDKSAIEFSGSFYESFGLGRNLNDSFLLAKLAVKAMRLPGPNVPHFYASDSASELDFVLTPEMAFA